MQYAVIPLGRNEGLQERVNDVAQETFNATAPQVFFLRYNGTEVQLRDALGLGPEGTGDAIIIRVDHFAGHSYRSLWEWLGRPPNLD